MRSLAFLLFLAFEACASAPPAQPTAIALPTVTPTTPPAPTANVPRPRVPRAGEILEARELGGEGDIHGGVVAMDARGNLFVVGSFRGTATFGDLPPLAAEQEDAYVVALDASNRPMWSKRIGGASLDYGNDIAVDAIDGGIYVSGAFESASIDLGSGPLRNAGVHDLFLAKYDASGKLLFAKRFGDAQDQISLRLRAHPRGGVVATGWFNGALDFGAGVVRSPFGKASFVARLDAEGRAKWSRAFGHRLDYAETDAVVDARDHVFVSGGSDEAILPNGKPSARDDLGPVLLELDDTGALVSAKRFGSGADNVSTAIALDASGALRMGVGSRGVVDFGDGRRTPAAGREAIYVTSLDARGAPTWTQSFAPERLASIGSLRIDANGNAIVTSALLHHEPEPAPFGIDADRGVVTKITPAGVVAWQRMLSDGFRTGADRAVIDARGRIIVSGSVAKAVNTAGSSRVRSSLVITTIQP